MAIEFIGIAQTQDGSETRPPGGPAVQPDFVSRLARAHEQSGFDRVLVAHISYMPDGFIVANQVLNATEHLGVLLAYRPGFIAPTVAARKYATLDAFHPGRVAMHVITGGDDADQRRDGDHLDKQARYARTDEYLEILRREWSSGSPFDFDGEHYKVRGAHSSVRPTGGALPIYFGGASDDAVRVGAKHADVYMFWGEPLEGIRSRIAQVRAAATALGRSPRFSVSLRPIVAGTEDAAWRRAHEILETTEQRVEQFRTANGARYTSSAEGTKRLLQYAERGEILDKRLWTPLAKATGAAGNSTALVGSYEQVAESLLDYVRLGISTLLIRGYSPVEDAVEYANLVHLVRDELAREEHHVLAG